MTPPRPAPPPPTVTRDIDARENHGALLFVARRLARDLLKMVNTAMKQHSPLSKPPAPRL